MTLTNTLSNCIKITPPVLGLGDASTEPALSIAEGVGMSVLTSTQLSTSEEVILTIILSHL